MIQQFCAWSCYVECSRFLHDRSPMNDLLLNDQQQLNAVFDYGNLPDVLLNLMSVLLLFNPCTINVCTLLFNPWNSHGPKIYKINLIKTMVNRLKSICSNKILLDRDLSQLKKRFLWSGYPNFIIEKFLRSL